MKVSICNNSAKKKPLRQSQCEVGKFYLLNNYVTFDGSAIKDYICTEEHPYVYIQTERGLFNLGTGGFMKEEDQSGVFEVDVTIELCLVK